MFRKERSVAISTQEVPKMNISDGNLGIRIIINDISLTSLEISLAYRSRCALF